MYSFLFTSNKNLHKEILYKDTEIVSNNNRIYFTAPNYDDITKFNCGGV